MTIIKPLENRILVRPDKPSNKTDSGLIIPDTVKQEDKPKSGTVLLTGDGVDGKPMAVRAGDKIMYGTFTGTVVEQDGETLLMMRESDVICITEFAPLEFQVSHIRPTQVNIIPGNGYVPGVDGPIE